MNRLVDKHVKYSLWNIPIILDMKNVTNLVLDSVTEVNFLKLVPLKESQSPGGKTVIPLAFDFNEKQTTYTFFTILDFLQSMGGFQGFITPLFGMFGPLMCVSYHAKLAVIMKERSNRAHREDTRKALKKMKEEM